MKLRDLCDKILALKEKYKEYDCEVIFWQSEEASGFEIWDSIDNYKKFWKDVFKVNISCEVRDEFELQHKLEECDVSEYIL